MINHPLVAEVTADYEKHGKNSRELMDYYTTQIVKIHESFNKMESMIPVDHEYWDFRSKLLLVKQMNSEGVFEAALASEPSKEQSYRMLKYGIGHRFNREI